jgi:tetratricopeptide (TPR) repeat protein
MVAVLCLAAGCAPHRRAAGFSPGPEAPTGAPRETLVDYIARVRHRSMAAVARSTAGRLEEQNADLSAALRELRSAPSAAGHRAVAEIYVRIRVLDAAFDHFDRATRLDRSDAAAYEGLARIWRDWGLPHLGLADAHRAIHYAPQSASARNTLGTLLQTLGQYGEARAAYEQALARDAEAAYALNNLCHLSLAEGKKAEAVRLCRQALALQPGLPEARGNLALAEASGSEP